MAVAGSECDTVFLFRRNAHGLFEDPPYRRIDGPNSRLEYPHDVAFSVLNNTELLAVAQRGRGIGIYAKDPTNEDFGTEPVFEIYGRESRLNFTDGVTFVPPHDEYIAACNATFGNITFYRRVSDFPIRFELTPVLELTHPGVVEPDGVAFSSCGRWLATANHGKNTVSIFQGRNRPLPGEKLEYGPAPVTVIRDPGLRYPHSVAFTPETNHLVVTSAGAKYISVYAPSRQQYGLQWSQSPVLQIAVSPENIFKDVNAKNKQEGGPKGIAIHKRNLAVCSPEFGIKIYSFRELQ